MRTTLEIDDALFAEAARASAITKKRRLVEAGLAALIRQQRLERLAGMLGTTPMATNSAGLVQRRKSRFHSHSSA